MTLWSIWLEHNAQVWASTSTVVAAIVRLSDQFSLTEKNARVSELKSDRIVNCKCLHKPPRDFLKINIDAAFFSNSWEMGLEFSSPGCVYL